MGSRGLTIEPQVQFVQTPYFQHLIERSLTYLKAGVPVHLQGPSGTGKTTCALHLAQMLARPVVLIYGNDQFSPADLVGRHFGLRRKVLIDQYIHSVERREEEIDSDWVDGRLLAACKEGYIVVYDEFSRSRPEANNALLSVLEERVLELPATHRGDKYIRVHPEFRAIFTSNPDEYAGVHGRPDALMDRLISIDLGAMDEASELAITIAKTGIGAADAATVVDTVRRYRRQFPTRLGHSVRASLLIAAVLHAAGRTAEPGDPFFEQLCADVLGAGHAHRNAEGAGEVARSAGIRRDPAKDLSRPTDREPARTPEKEPARAAAAEVARQAGVETARPAHPEFARGAERQTSRD
ncbi:MAG TPA: gas vesicle protein GvpN [Symbiobacteriaceae bacterium]